MSEKYSREADSGYHLLLIESDPDAVTSFVESFGTTDAAEAVHVVRDAEEALDFINRRDPYAEAPRPDLILLDLDVPGADGERVLTELNDRSELRRIPVLVFTTADAAEGVARSYGLNANACLQKPTTSEEFRSLARAIEDFWFERARLPPK